MSVVQELEYLAKKHDLLWWHTPNEGKRPPREGARLKAMGMKSGISDLFFAKPTDEYSCLAIEMKSSVRAVVSPEQKDFLAHVKRIGGRAEICYTAQQAINLIKQHYHL